MPFQLRQESITVKDDAFTQEMSAIGTPLFGTKNRISRRDPKQRPDCTDSPLLSMLAGLAVTRPDYIRDMIREVDEGHVEVKLYDENGML